MTIEKEDPLFNVINNIRSATATLNQATDRAGEAVALVEQLLNKDGVGIPASIIVQLVEPPSGREVRLCYCRWKDGFRVVVSETSVGGLTKPWCEWDRSTKLETVAYLPRLLRRIESEVSDLLRLADRISVEVKEALAGT